jgi:hypothetical protein
MQRIWMARHREDCPRGEVQDVKHDEYQQQHTAPAHASRGKCADLGLPSGVVHRTRRVLDSGELPRHEDVQQHGRKERESNEPKQLAKALQECGIGVHLRRADEHLEISCHVPNHEQHQHQAGDCHDDLLADRRTV